MIKTPINRFDFQLPEELIAQYPLNDRGMSRLLVVDRGKESFDEFVFSDIEKIIPDDYFFVLNNTKVLKSRLYPKRVTGGKIEVFLLENITGNRFKAMTKGKVKIGDTLFFEDGEKCKIVDYAEDNLKIVEIDNYQTVIDKYGHIPLPPYIKRGDEENDKIRYQTVYAEKEGSVAAPTAGLHFTEDILNRLKAKHQLFYITLNVGIGTFKPIKTEYIEDHHMHKETFSISDDVKVKINELKSRGGKLLSVGTTTLRALESASSDGRVIKSGDLETDIFIRPGYEFNIVDGLVTNFHLPKSTLFILVCAFAGEKLMKEAYNYAIKNRFRFFSYGDAMLIL
ncbi:MAG: tRNA preQ1(34) S-adenosylmethionine ribosyltransferase-isomerase QueA [Deferribacterales bacterium]